MSHPEITSKKGSGHLQARGKQSTSQKQQRMTIHHLWMIPLTRKVFKDSISVFMNYSACFKSKDALVFVLAHNLDFPRK